MTLKLVAFGMPFITLGFMVALAWGIVRWNRRSADQSENVHHDVAAPTVLSGFYRYDVTVAYRSVMHPAPSSSVRRQVA